MFTVQTAQVAVRTQSRHCLLELSAFFLFYLGCSLGACLSKEEEGVADAETSAASFLILLQSLVGIFGAHAEGTEHS